MAERARTKGLGGRAIVCSDNAVLIDIKENHLPQKLKSYHGRTRNTASLISARQRLIFAITKLESSISPHAIALGVLASFDHTELNTAVYPDASATAEFIIGATADCVGGVIPDLGDSGLSTE